MHHHLTELNILSIFIFPRSFLGVSFQFILYLEPKIPEGRKTLHPMHIVSQKKKQMFMLKWLKELTCTIIKFGELSSAAFIAYNQQKFFLLKQRQKHFTNQSNIVMQGWKN